MAVVDVAFAVSGFSFRGNILLLMLFTAGNLLPPQVIIVPLYRIYLLAVPGAPERQRADVRPVRRYRPHPCRVPDGFCTFVLTNYMKTLDGADRGVTGRRSVGVADLRRVILPLCRPALAALATLEFTFMYNDFFWALLLMKTGDERPITSALNNLQGAFFTDKNLLARRRPDGRDPDDHRVPRPLGSSSAA